MRPLSPAERAAVLARHPEATEADLDRLEELSSRRVYATDLDERQVRELDEEIAAIQARFPHLQEAVASVDERGQP
jgi:hypothetical protein